MENRPSLKWGMVGTILLLPLATGRSFEQPRNHQIISGGFFMGGRKKGVLRERVGVRSCCIGPLGEAENSEYRRFIAVRH